MVGKVKELFVLRIKLYLNISRFSSVMEFMIIGRHIFKFKVNVWMRISNTCIIYSSQKQDLRFKEMEDLVLEVDILVLISTQ